MFLFRFEFVNVALCHTVHVDITLPLLTEKAKKQKWNKCYIKLKMDYICNVSACLSRSINYVFTFSHHRSIHSLLPLSNSFELFALEIAPTLTIPFHRNFLICIELNFMNFDFSLIFFFSVIFHRIIQCVNDVLKLSNEKRMKWMKNCVRSFSYFEDDLKNYYCMKTSNNAALLTTDNAIRHETWDDTSILLFIFISLIIIFLLVFLFLLLAHYLS